MKKYLLMGVSLFLLSLISLNASALTASQIGSSTILNTISSDNWAGVAYSVEWKTLFTNYWGTIRWASESIYTGNLSIQYTSYPNYLYPDVISIWVGLSPAKIGTGTGSSSTSEENNFIQAGYDICVTGSYKSVLYFVMTVVNGQFIYAYEKPIPSGVPTHLNVFLENLANGTALANFYVFYANGTYWTTTIYTSMPWINTGAAMSIVEAPASSPSGGFYYELPYLSGGMINFAFSYVGSDGNEHIGPSNNPVGTMYADVYNLNEPSNYNLAYAQIYNGWANSYGGWDYLYQFAYPFGTTYGL
ncbi:hypothetical protein [Saccharolobus islandicus]|uniref:hypothetical protein n=1 Tax=Saccharolobus islandicus TaxID=43080 RepID=UPI0003611D6B|nr:hypothetical protein [Sulfolobus islandicus]